MTPVNYRTPDAGAPSIDKEVAYAMQVTQGYVRWIAHALGRPPHPSVLNGLTILELGPGRSLAQAALLACAGARVVVSDRFATRWHGPYHGAVFEGLIPHVEQWAPGSSGPLRRLLAAQAFLPSIIEIHETAAEHLTTRPAGWADIIVSNAVLEHLADVPRAFAGLAHVTKSRGFGLHQVDFRDHRDFSRPLEYLTLSRTSFDRLFEERLGECGNRWRSRQMTAAFTDAGFRVRSAEANMHADAAYVADVRSRLHEDVGPMSDEDLEVLSVFYTVQRAA